jgi:hypothetical protein
LLPQFVLDQNPANGILHARKSSDPISSVLDQSELAGLAPRDAIDVFAWRCPHSRPSMVS